MALNKFSNNPSYSFIGTMSHQTQNYFIPRKLWFGAKCSHVPRRSNFVSFRGFLDKKDGVFKRTGGDCGKARALSQYCQFVQDKSIYTDTDLIKSHGSSNHGLPINGFPQLMFSEKLTVAVDVDEVLGSFVSALNQFIAERYHSFHSVSEYYVYEFFKVWKCSRGQADIRVHEFFKTHYFQKGIHPIPDARRVLDKLHPFCNFSVVTSRQDVIKDHTLEWIENHYPGLFQEIHFGNHFALDGRSRPKSEICNSFGAKVLIDDNPSYALECAEVGISVLLFDYDNSYPWSKSDLACSHPLVTKVHNWSEVEKALLLSVISDTTIL
ncbi:5' nucleotidase, deoxy (Pyrimidine), cytosolic type C proteindomain containing protein-like protein [Zostera marina]|uniref:5' nucleotidase, deoxy (Pyrimidine), cytosolic type C proteindomain containing protein-like protein n=1 Tax=Zostera marina TaxID=29655 RepID=A0A0K9NM52_ZOSMR|nr:5' nucleotidase, deoxy (Pyrimidine), cytosolic type C proteindomain containing protein-like protein [Zostera marina]